MSLSRELLGRLVDNGLEVFLKPSGCDVKVYDYSFTLCRLYSDKGN